MPVMKINVLAPSNKSTIKAHELPIGTIGKVDTSIELYVIHTNENGNAFLKVWPQSTAGSSSPSIESSTYEDLKKVPWDVELLPKGTKLTLTF